MEGCLHGKGKGRSHCAARCGARGHRGLCACLYACVYTGSPADGDAHCGACSYCDSHAHSDAYASRDTDTPADGDACVCRNTCTPADGDACACRNTYTHYGT